MPSERRCALHRLAPLHRRLRAHRGAHCRTASDSDGISVPSTRLRPRVHRGHRVALQRLRLEAAAARQLQGHRAVRLQLRPIRRQPQRRPRLLHPRPVEAQRAVRLQREELELLTRRHHAAHDGSSGQHVGARAQRRQHSDEDERPLHGHGWGGHGAANLVMALPCIKAVRMLPHVASPDAPAGPPALPLAHAQEDSAPDTSREPYAEDLRDLLSARSHGMGRLRAPGDGAGPAGNPASPPLPPHRADRRLGLGGPDAFGMVAVAGLRHQRAGRRGDLSARHARQGPGRSTAHINTVASALPIAPNSLLVASPPATCCCAGPGRPTPSPGTPASSSAPARSSPWASPATTSSAPATPSSPATTRPTPGSSPACSRSPPTCARTSRRTRAPRSPTAGDWSWCSGRASRCAGYLEWFHPLLGAGRGHRPADAGGGLDLAYHHDFGGEGGRLVALTLKLQVQ